MVVKSFKCNRCGIQKDYIIGDFLPTKYNIIADQCPDTNCYMGEMVINFDDAENFNDGYMEKYYFDFFKYLDNNSTLKY